MHGDRAVPLFALDPKGQARGVQYRRTARARSRLDHYRAGGPATAGRTQPNTEERRAQAEERKSQAEERRHEERRHEENERRKAAEAEATAASAASGKPTDEA